MQNKLHKPSIDSKNLIPMGRIIGAFGVKGWVKIKADTQESDALGRYKNLYLFIEDQYVLYNLAESFVQKNILHAKFDEVLDRDSAALLRGITVAVSRDEFPVNDDGEYYWVDLIGTKVYNPAGDYFGVVIDLIETGANAVLVVKNEDIESLIPFVDVYVANVDLLNKKITVYWELDY